MEKEAKLLKHHEPASKSKFRSKILTVKTAANRVCFTSD